MRTFAEKHPGTVTAIINFAVTLGDQGGLDRAGWKRQHRWEGEDVGAILTDWVLEVVFATLKNILEEAVRLQH
jgi:hypothetical protein